MEAGFDYHVAKLVDPNALNQLPRIFRRLQRVALQP